MIDNAINLLRERAVWLLVYHNDPSYPSVIFFVCGLVVGYSMLETAGYGVNGARDLKNLLPNIVCVFGEAVRDVMLNLLGRCKSLTHVSEHVPCPMSPLEVLFGSNFLISTQHAL